MASQVPRKACFTAGCTAQYSTAVRVKWVQNRREFCEFLIVAPRNCWEMIQVSLHSETSAASHRAMNFFRFTNLRVIATSALLVMASSLTARAEMKIAVVDTQRAIMDTEEGMRAQATLKKIFDNRQRELDKKQEQLQKEREDIEKQQGILSKEALSKRLEAWQRDMSQLQATFLEYNKELQKKQGELTQPIYQRTMTLIRRLATTEGYDLVVDRQAAPFVRGDLDVTDKLIQMINSGAGDKDTKSGKADTKKAPAAAPAASGK